MTTMDFLEFYPDEVEKFSDYCDKALEDAGFDDIEIEEFLFSPLQDAVDQIMHGVSQIPRDMRPADFFLDTMGNYTVEALQERFPDEEISFERNRLDCHLVINGEDYSPKYDNIKSMFEYYYAASALALKCGDELALTTAVIERGEVKIAVDLSEYNLAEALYRTEAHPHNIERVLDGVDEWCAHLYRNENTIEMKIEVTAQLAGETTAGYISEVPLTRGEQEILMELTQAVYEKEIVNARNLYGEPVRKSNPQMGLGD